jgi:two-component system, sporulation sensor kinase A
MKTTALTANAQQLVQIMHAIADGITVQNASGQLVFVNQAAATLMGFKTPDEVLKLGGQAIAATFKIFDEQGQPLSLQALPGRRVLQGIDEPEIVVGFTSKNHPTIRWAAIKALPIINSAGTVELAVNVIQDITHLKQTEFDLREANERVTKLLEQTLEVRSQP